MAVFEANLQGKVKAQLVMPEVVVDGDRYREIRVPR